MSKWTARNHYLTIPLAIVYGVGVVICFIIIILLLKRRHRLIIRERSFPLLLLSCIGNLAGMSCISIDGLTQDESNTGLWVLFYVNLFLEYLFFVPFLLRVYYTKVAYFDFMREEKEYWRQEHRLRARWWASVLVAGLVPYFLVPVLLGLLYSSSSFPACSGPNCSLEVLIMHIAWELVEFLEVMTLLCSVYYLRGLEDRLGIATEVRVICGVTFAMSLADYYEDNAAIYLVQTTRDLVILFISNLLPVLRSYNDGYEIWLTPDVIESFDLSIIQGQGDCLVAFREYLQTIPIEDVEEYSISALTFIGEFVSADAYMWFYVAVKQLQFRPSFSTAFEIRKSYLRSHPRLFLKEITDAVEDSLVRCRESGVKSSLPDVFAPAQDYAVEKMRNEYFPKYLRSRRFVQLREDVERWLRLKNRDQLVRS